MRGPKLLGTDPDSGQGLGARHVDSFHGSRARISAATMKPAGVSSAMTVSAACRGASAAMDSSVTIAGARRMESCELLITPSAKSTALA